MLYGELKFYKNSEIIKTVPDEDFSEFNPKELQIYVAELVAATGATKAISSCVYHGGTQGTIDTVLFPVNDDG